MCIYFQNKKKKKGIYIYIYIHIYICIVALPAFRAPAPFGPRCPRSVPLPFASPALVCPTRKLSHPSMFVGVMLERLQR